MVGGAVQRKRRLAITDSRTPVAAAPLSAR